MLLPRELEDTGEDYENYLFLITLCRIHSQLWVQPDPPCFFLKIPPNPIWFENLIILGQIKLLTAFLGSC